MHSRLIAAVAVYAVLVCGSVSAVLAQGASSPQSDLTPVQRLEVMRSRLETMRRSLNSAIAAMNSKDAGEKKDEKKSADDPRERLRGLEKEVGSILSEVSDLRGKVDRSERVETERLDKLEASVADVETRAQAGLTATAGERSASAAAGSTASSKQKKKKGRFFGLLGGGGDDKYEDLTGTVAPGRDRVLFEEAAKEVRKGNYETGRLLFNTIVTTYPDSPFLPLAKLAYADSFYLEGTTSGLIQAAAAYQDWLTFFPTDMLADRVMLKMAEAEMRQMGLSDRDVSRARKAEQRLKVLLQQFPNTSLRAEVQTRLNEVQENLAMHNLQVARFYIGRNERGRGGLKGAQSRLREIVEKYPNFSYMDEVLYKLGALYLQEEEPDEAGKYFQQVARDWPNSEYAEKAREQLNVVGLAVPDPDPIKVNMAPPPRPSFTEKVFREVLGTTPVTVDKNGVLISKDDKENDLIARAIQNGGQLPATTPAPVQQRRPPARTFPQQPSGQPANPAAAPENKTGGSDLKLQPTQPGPQTPGSNPAVPTTAPATPAGTRP